MAIEITPWDSTEHLQTEEDIQLCLEAALEEADDDPTLLIHELSVISRVKNMSQTITITLDDEVLAFVDKQGDDRSQLINKILLKEKQRIFLKEIDEAYLEDANDPVAQAERALWEVTVADGLEDEEDE